MPRDPESDTLYGRVSTPSFIAISLTNPADVILIHLDLIMVIAKRIFLFTMMKKTIFVAFWALFLAASATAAWAADQRIRADEAYQQVVNGKLTLIDIRSPQEWEKSEIPKGSLAISMHNPAGKKAFKDAVLAAVGGDKERPIALICAVGGRSNWAQRYLESEGFKTVMDVSEGMFGRGKNMPGWLKRGLPTEPCPDCAPKTKETSQ